jgi:putative endonuclease
MLHKALPEWRALPFMTFYVYILYSKEKDRYYVGETSDLISRMESHGNGISPYTSMAKDWELVYREEYKCRSDSLARERAIKRKKSRKYIEWLISGLDIKGT